MKIEIDTKKDSVDDIKKTIDFLLKFVDAGKPMDELPTVGEGSFNLFEQAPVQQPEDDDDEPSPMTIVEY